MKRSWLIGGGAVAVIAAAGAWFAFGRGGPVQGPGAFGSELAQCQERVYGEMRMPSYMEFVPGTEWHQGNAAAVKIGGTVKLLNNAGKPAAHAYECQARAGRVLNSTTY